MLRQRVESQLMPISTGLACFACKLEMPVFADLLHGQCIQLQAAMSSACAELTEDKLGTSWLQARAVDCRNCEFADPDQSTVMLWLPVLTQIVSLLFLT